MTEPGSLFSFEETIRYLSCDEWQEHWYFGRLIQKSDESHKGI
jgi:hypothetical protein